MTYPEKYHHARVYAHAEPAEPHHTDGWKLTGLCLLVVSAGSMAGLFLIAIAKLLEGR